MKWFKRKSRLAEAKRDLERERMRDRMLMCMIAMGFEPDDDVQCWMRLSEIILDHEMRLKKLEGS